jgi:penicillin-binding protein 1A
MTKWLIKRLLMAMAVMLALGLIGGGALLALLHHYGQQLPDYRQLANYEPPTVTRLHAGDGQLLAEYATEKRIFVPIEAIPRRVVEAFLAAEDKNFYTHSGVDWIAVSRAAMQNVLHLGADRRPVGGSTITQQVAKAFLLNNEPSMARKIKEAILAFRIERVVSKAHILELYLNEIYLGGGAYGVAAAALSYFDKSLDQLTIPEAAFLAALPKGPSNYNPVRFPDAARTRRDWVIQRMAEDGYITAADAAAARKTPLVIVASRGPGFVDAGYFGEEVRRDLVERFGETKLYGGGLSVRTTVDPKLQAAADRALRAGLVAYDRRHGWRGALGRLALATTTPASWVGPLADFPLPVGTGAWRPAVVLAVDEGGATIGIGPGGSGRIPFAELAWARPALADQRIGNRPRRPADVLGRGDIILVEPVGEGPDGKPYPAASYALRQVPEISGAIVALDPHTGRVLAMSGGYQFEHGRDEFNRAVQARRQPGSAFKPFVYLAAMSHGFTPSSIVVDAAIELEQGPGLPIWKPANYEKNFLGPNPLRVGLEQSRNLMTVRLAQNVGMAAIARTAERFGVVAHLPHELSMALGTGETTLLDITTAYGELANGGRKITPTFIDWVQDRHGKLVYRFDQRPCPACANAIWAGQAAPQLSDTRPQLDDARSIYQVIVMLQGVIERGTAVAALALGNSIAGKTGTTDDGKDTWFIGFTRDLVCGVYIGFDQPRTQGPGETGATAALPVFVDFMKVALKDRPAMPFHVPPGIAMVRVRQSDGLLAQPGDRRVVLEPFKLGTVPVAADMVLDAANQKPAKSAPARPVDPALAEADLGGLY